MSWLVRAANPIVWRLPGRAARKLFSFALAEHGSMIDLLQAARTTESAERASLYLRHAGDEARHARLFARRSAELCVARGVEPFGEPRADTEDLYARLGELDFLAFVHRGERRGRIRFEAHRDHFARHGQAADSALFEAILADERRHEAYTHELLVSLAGGPAPARAALRRVARWEAWRTWRRAGRALAGGVYAVLMYALYLAAFPLAAMVKLTRPARSGWTAPTDSGPSTQTRKQHGGRGPRGVRRLGEAQQAEAE